MSGPLENPTKQTVTQVTTANEVREFIGAVPRAHHDTRATWLQRAGSFLGLTPRRTRSIWYGEKVRIDHDEYLRMRQRVEQLRAADQRRREILADVDALVGAASRMERAPVKRSRDDGDE